MSSSLIYSTNQGQAPRKLQTAIAAGGTGHVQEWGAVVQTMNRYSDDTLYFGLVISPTGFTSGCEAWATSHNVAIVPPLKGRRLAFNQDTVLRMFERTLVALRARVNLRVNDLRTAPAFFDFVYRIVADFEGHQEAEGQSLLVDPPGVGILIRGNV